MPGSPAAAVTLSTMLRESGRTAVLTGAGVSTESGLADFRSGTGLWRQVNPFKAASIDAWRDDPVAFFNFYRQRLARLGGARPNIAHRILALLQGSGYVRTIITQNVDGLHQAAGSRGVVEVHGNLREASCLNCGRTYGAEVLDGEDDYVPRCQKCSTVLKPRVVLFGETLPSGAWERAVEAAASCNLFLVVGTSLQVSPVNLLPMQAIRASARLAIINLEPTPYDLQAHLVWHDRAGASLSSVAAHLGLSAGLEDDDVTREPPGRDHGGWPRS